MPVPDPLTARIPDAPRWGAWRLACVAALVAGAAAAMLMTSGQMADLRLALPPLSRALNWLDTLPGPLDMYHVAFFALLALALRLLLPHVQWARLLLGLALLAVVTELLQFGTVGRTPKLVDVRDDLIGAGIGLLLGVAVLACARRVWRSARAAGFPRRRDGIAWNAHGWDTSPVGTTAAPPLEPDVRAVVARLLVELDADALARAVAHHGTEAIVAACEHEGVVSLVHARLADLGAAEQPLQPLQHALASRARLCAGRSMLCVSEARKVQQALAEAGIPCLWLKGVALGQWLYPSMHLRDIADIDLLLPDHATLLRAAEVVGALGYALPNPHIAGDLVVHELLAYSERTGLELDLHWDLSNNALFARRLCWEELAVAAIALPVLGPQARGLSPDHALLHACFHLAAGRLTWRRERLRWLHDIHLLASRFNAAGWQPVIAAATSARLADPVAYALRASRVTFGTDVDPSALAALDAAAAREAVRSDRLHRWGAYQLACWRRWPDLATRLRWLRQLLFPDASHLRARYGGEGASPLRITARRLGDGFRRWWGYVARS
jgi:hypothetical protein